MASKSTQPIPLRPNGKVALAFQGGGLHTALQLGEVAVLAPYLEQNGFAVTVAVGTSGGGFNAVYFANGWESAARGAKATAASTKVEQLWLEIARLAPKHLAEVPVDAFNYLIDQAQQGKIHPYSLTGPVQMLNALATYATQHHPAVVALGHLNDHVNKVHPLEALVAKDIDFAKFNQPGKMQVFINTVDALSGRQIVYGGRNDGKLGPHHTLTARAMAAAGSLPELFGGGVMIDDLHNWDGGFLGNPPLQVIYDHCPEVTDIIVLRVSPLEQADVPPPGDRDAAYDRREQLRWNAALEAELQLLPRLAKAEGRVLNIHVVAPPRHWPYSQKSKVDPLGVRLPFIRELEGVGARTMKLWLHNHGAQLGRESSYHASYVMASDRRHHLVRAASPNVA